MACYAVSKSISDGDRIHIQESHEGQNFTNTR